MDSSQISNIEIVNNDVIYNHQNNLHISVIKPIEKKIIHCTESKVNAYYKPEELVEEVTNYVAEGEGYLVDLYKQMKKKEMTEKKKNANLLKLAKSKPMQFKDTRQLPKRKNVKKPEPTLFPIKENFVPQIDTVFVPKLEKNIEIVTKTKDYVNIDYTYMIPKPIVIPVEVPVLKFKDNFTIIPIKKKIIPVIKYSDEVVYVDCYIEKPYLVLENLVLPVPCDAPIKEKKYIDKVPPISDPNNINNININNNTNENINITN